MKKKLISIILTGLIICSAASCANSKPAEPAPAETAPVILGQESEPGAKYVLYLGLNDKDTYEQK